MFGRREFIALGAGASATALLNAHIKQAFAQSGSAITRVIPSSGEQLPIIGLGSSATFSAMAGSADASALKDVMQTLVDNGGKLFDTAPSYGTAEQVAAQIVNDLGIQSRVFWATKVNVAPRGGGKADPAAVRAQIEESFKRFRAPKIDLIQVHNMGDPPTQLGILKEMKAAGRIRYLGITTTFPEQYEHLIQVMRTEPLDFIGVDYAVDNRDVENVILPLAQERRMGVLVYAPFGRTRLFQRVRGRELPPWAAEFGATTWAQFFLKFVAAHPAVTVITPATSNPKNMLDNLGGGVGRLPDQAQLKQMTAFVDALPNV